MAHAQLGLRVQQFRVHRVAGQRLQSQGRDELAGSAGHDDPYAGTELLQLPYQFRRLVGGDATADADQYIAIEKMCHSHVRTGKIAKREWKDTTP